MSGGKYGSANQWSTFSVPTAGTSCYSVSRQHVSDIWMSPGWLKGTVDGLCGWLVVVWKEALHLTVTSLCYKLLFSDPSGQTAVQPVYTEVYTILQWWMQHVCDPMPAPPPPPPTLPSTPVTSHLSPSIDSAHYRSFLVLCPTEALLFVSSSSVNPVVSIHPKAAAGCLVSITSCWSRGAACSNSRSIVCRFTQIVFKKSVVSLPPALTRVFHPNGLWTCGSVHYFKLKSLFSGPQDRF